MKIYLDTIGCRLNQSEIETFARQFRATGHVLVAEPSEADLAVVNTCSVTVAAAADSRKKIRRMNRAGVPQVVVTGCWSTLEPKEAARLTGVTLIIPNNHKDGLVSTILEIPEINFDLEPIVREPIPGARSRTRAYIKVQDGCDNRCTFCITTLARGSGRSRPITEVIEDIHYALEGGTQEIVLTGVHMGSWGQDFSEPQELATLIESILKDTDTPRLRLSSLEPWDIDDSFFNLWQDDRLARHLHLPLQSGCRTTLKRMARKTTPEAYTKLVETARAAIPDLAITTDIIVGFPGETEDEFTQSLAYVKLQDFTGGHVFTYSERPGTSAARMPGSVPYPIRKDRNTQMRAVLEESERGFKLGFIGSELPVLWESATPMNPEGWTLGGLTDNYLRVSAKASNHLWNQITKVKLTGLNGNGLIGQFDIEKVKRQQ